MMDKFCQRSRGIALQICLDFSLKNFLRTFQLQVFWHGFQSLCFSDQGSPITAGSKIISNHLKNADVCNLMAMRTCVSYNMRHVATILLGLVETCVKMVKWFVYVSIGNNITGYSDFKYLVAEINRRKFLTFKKIYFL